MSELSSFIRSGLERGAAGGFFRAFFRTFDAAKAMPWLPTLLLMVLVVLQGLLWFGDGGLRDVNGLRDELAGRRAVNAELELNIRGVQAQINDLQSGSEAVEERARYEMGLVRPGEPFVQYVTPSGSGKNPTKDPTKETGQPRTSGSASSATGSTGALGPLEAPPKNP